MVNKVLIRTLVKEFYRSNAGFFLIVIGLAFGFLKTPEHMAIAGALASNPIYYSIPAALWSLYALKTYLYVHRAKQLEEHVFLTDFVMIKGLTRKLSVVYLQFLFLLPILGYGAFLAAMAFQIDEVKSAIYVVGGNFFILMTTAHFTHLKLIQPVDAKSVSKSYSWTRRLPKKLSTLFIHHLFLREPLGLLITKIASISIVIGASLLFEAGDGDRRLFALAILLSAGINSTLSFRNALFHNQDLRIFRNLPIGTGTRFLSVCGSYLLIMLPELIVLFGNNPTVGLMITLSKSVLLFLSLMMLYDGIAQQVKREMDHFVKYPFLITATLFFVILGYVDPMIISGVLLIVSFWLFKRANHQEGDLTTA